MILNRDVNVVEVAARPSEHYPAKQVTTIESYSGVEAPKGDSLHRGRGEKILTLPQSHR